jgi:hypothetical protein
MAVVTVRLVMVDSFMRVQTELLNVLAPIGALSARRIDPSISPARRACRDDMLYCTASEGQSQQ